MRLIEIEIPAFGGSSSPPKLTLEECEGRLERTREAMERLGLTHLVVYGDREHFANIAWLTGFDPRFEEALLIVRLFGDPLVVVGTECESYLPISPLFRAGRLRHERFEPFSLLDISRDESRQLDEIFGDEGISGTDVRIGCVGWKYYLGREHSLGKRAIELPAYIIDTLRTLTPQVMNATAIFQHPGKGLRSSCSAQEIATFEHANTIVSNGMWKMIRAIRLGMTDFELAEKMGFNGLPHSCHWTLKTGRNRISLAGASGAVVERGQPLSANIGLRGANCCRCAFVADGEQDAPRGYVDRFVGPYVKAMAAWFSMLKIGTRGGAVDRVMRELLPFGKFHVKLNPGHLIHLEEWLSSPFKPGSEIELHSGMAIQSDVIPTHPEYVSTRMEDTFVLADEELRATLGRHFPDCLARCDARREFMRGTLGFDVGDDVYPLSNLPGVVSPYLLAPNLVVAV
jgi:Xaa-Pro aminopeptidase